MAIAKDATSSTHAQGVSGLSWSHTCAGGDLLLMVHSGTNGTPVSTSGVTYNSAALNNLWSASRNWVAASGWSIVAPATGANTVAITLSATEDNAFGQAVSYTGVDQAIPHGTAAAANGSSDSPAVPTLSSATGEVCLGFLMTSDVSITSGAGQTAEISDLNFASDSAQTDSEPGAASVDITWTTGVNPWTCGGVPIKPVVVGGDTALSCIIRSAAVVSTSLLTAISLLGSMLGSTSINAALSTSISIASAPTARATVASELDTAIPLGTTVSARSNISSVLSTQISIETAVAARATVSSVLSTSIPLSTAIAAQAQTASDLTTAIPLASVTSARATVVASFEAIAADFVSAVQARATVVGDLSTSIPLASLISARCTGASNLSTAISLASSSFAVSTLVADMAVVQIPSIVSTHNTVRVAVRSTQIKVAIRSTRVRFSNV